MNEERIAVLESRVKRNEKDVGQLYKFFREHMEKEEENDKAIIAELNSVNSKMDKQKSFWGGMMFTFTAIGAIIGAWVSWIKATGG